MSPLALTKPLPGFREIRLEPGETPASGPSVRARMPRFLSLAESVDPVSVLSRLRVACLGVGAVGRIACEHFARLAVEALYICDHGTYKPESRLTQPIDPDEVGRSKAESVARLAKRLSPATTVFAYDGSFETLGATALADADIVLMATDNIRAELECGQHCLHLGKPLVQASVHGGSLTAEVRFYANASGNGPCPACGLTREERVSLAGEVVYSCDGTVARTTESPTTSTSHLCSIAGDLAVNQILRHVLGLGASVVDQEVEWNGFTLKSWVTPLERKPGCPADHAVWATRHSDRPVADFTLRQVAQAAGLHQDGALERATFRIGALLILFQLAGFRGYSVIPHVCQCGFQIADLVRQRVLVQGRSVKVSVSLLESNYLFLYLLSSLYPVLLLKTGFQGSDSLLTRVRFIPRVHWSRRFTGCPLNTECVT